MPLDIFELDYDERGLQSIFHYHLSAAHSFCQKMHARTSLRLISPSLTCYVQPLLDSHAQQHLNNR